MSPPKNNLEEVRRAKTELPSSSVKPSLSSKSFTFKPAALSASIPNVTVRKPLPSFRSSGFGKSSSIQPSTPAREPEVPDISASSIGTAVPHIPIKRTSSDSSIASEQSLSSKRVKESSTSNKENVLPSNAKGKGRARAVSSSRRHSPARKMDDSEDEKPWLKLAVPSSNPFEALDKDWPLPSSVPDPQRSPKRADGTTPLPRTPAATEFRKHERGRANATDHVSKFPDLLGKSTKTLEDLYRCNYQQNLRNDEAIFQSFGTELVTADIHMLNIWKNLLSDRIRAIQELIMRRREGKEQSPSVSQPTSYTRAAPTLGSTNATPGSLPASELANCPSAPTLSSATRGNLASSAVGTVCFAVITPNACPNRKDHNGASTSSAEAHDIIGKATRVARYEAADDDEIPIPQSDDALWDSVDNIGEEAFTPNEPTKPSNPAPSPESVTGPIAEHSNQTASPFYGEAMRVLKEVFGFHSFRNNQFEAINATLSGRDVFVLMPTGGGKSLCFQCPAVCRSGKTHGVTVVISPLIALMQDQVKALESKGVDVALWNSENSSDDVHEIKQRLLASRKPAMVYVTPEKLKESHALKSVLTRLYRDGELARFVVDEAHCISSWGRDFRDAYMALGNLRDEYPAIPIMALTATAKMNVVDDIIHRLKMHEPVRLKESFNRPNLHYDVRPKPRNVLNEVANFITSKYPNKCGIIYALSRNSCEEIAKNLREKYSLKAKHYHAKMSPQDKHETQAAWKSGKCDIIVATIAFGMGIDKPDVRYVIHYTMPKSLDGYYQETGRAGRDGDAAECVLFYTYGDVAGLVRMIGNKDGPRISPDEEKRQREDVYAVVSYCQDSTTCRRVQVLRYFGESFDPAGCRRGCNNCTREGPTFDQDFTQAAHDAAKLTKEILDTADRPSTQNYCQDVYMGLNRKEIKSRGHSELTLHGEGRGLSRETVERLFSKLLEMSVFRHVSVVNNSGYHNLYLELGPALGDFLAKTPIVTLPMRHHDAGSTAVRKSKNQSRPRKACTTPKTKRAVPVEDLEAISFYDDDDDFFDQTADQEDVIETEPSPTARPAQRQVAAKENADDLEQPTQDQSRSLYAQLKSACYAKCRGDKEDFLPDSTLQMLALLKPKDPRAFRELLRNDNQDRFSDTTELTKFVNDKDAQLREIVLTIILKHDVAATQRLLDAKPVTFFNTAKMWESYSFRSSSGLEFTSARR